MGKKMRTRLNICVFAAQMSAQARIWPFDLATSGTGRLSLCTLRAFGRADNL